MRVCGVFGVLRILPFSGFALPFSGFVCLFPGAIHNLPNKKQGRNNHFCLNIAPAEIPGGWQK
jgi:hypothetical protein